VVLVVGNENILSVNTIPWVENGKCFMIIFQRIAGDDSELQQHFTDALGSTAPYTEMQVKDAINELNNKRKERLMLSLSTLRIKVSFVLTL